MCRKESKTKQGIRRQNMVEDVKSVLSMQSFSFLLLRLKVKEYVFFFPLNRATCEVHFMALKSLKPNQTPFSQQIIHAQLLIPQQSHSETLPSSITHTC